MKSQVDPLVTSIWERIKTWQGAGDGMFWKPVLKVKVAPGADEVYSDLATLLEDSGIEVKKTTR